MTCAGVEEWAKAGMLDPTGNGNLDRPLGVDFSVLVPRQVTVGDGLVQWHWQQLETEWREPRPPLLEDFIDLADAEDAAIGAFVERWGPLLLCPCGRPWDHPPIALQQSPCNGPNAAPYSDEHTTEPLASWRGYALRARSVLAIAADLHRGKLPPKQVWDELLRTGLGVSIIDNALSLPLRRSFPFGRQEVAMVIDEWLLTSGVRLSFEWPYQAGADLADQSRPKLGFVGANGLMPYLGTQIALAVAQADAFCLCASCGRPFVPHRRPAATKRVYCSRVECAVKARHRDAQRDKRRKERRS